MHAASRSALKQSIARLEQLVNSSDDRVGVASRVGVELFDCVGVLDSERPLRIAVAEASTTGEQRAKLVGDVFGGKIDDATLKILASAASDVWSTPKEMRAGLVELGRRALLMAADASGQLDQVEEELFELSRILEREGKLTQLLTDRTASPAARRSLLAAVLYGKVLSTTEVLALQAVNRPAAGPIDDIAALSTLAASIRGKKVARVVSAAPLTQDQVDTLTTKLSHIYASPMVVHSEVDPSLLGGMIIRVGSEVIDGSLAGKLTRLRDQVA